MNYVRSSLYILRAAVDLFCLWVSFLLTELLVTEDYSINSIYFFLSFNLSFVWLVSSRATLLYDDFRLRNYSYEFISFLKNVVVQLVSLIIMLFFLKESNLSRTFALMYVGLLVIVIGSQKYLLRLFLKNITLYKRNIRSLLIIGAGEVGIKFYESILHNAHYSYRLVGFLDDKKNPALNGQYLGNIDRLEEILNTERVDNVIVALPNYAIEKLDYVMSTCEKYTTRVRVIPDYFKYISNKFSFSMFGGFPVISVRDDRINELHWRILKRFFDIVVSLIAIICFLSWLYPLLAIMIKINSPGPIIFRQERWGRNNKKFYAYKFRSMKCGNNDVDAKGKYMQAVNKDPRVTKLGKFLRKTNIDEMPQFINVLKGEMSIIGPRPHPTPLNMESKGCVKYYLLRHLVKPGISGWAQVHGFRGSTKEPHLMQKRVEYDLWYIENWSIWLDVQIILLTVWRMVKGDPNAY